MDSLSIYALVLPEREEAAAKLPREEQTKDTGNASWCTAEKKKFDELQAMLMHHHEQQSAMLGTQNSLLERIASTLTNIEAIGERVNSGVDELNKTMKKTNKHLARKRKSRSKPQERARCLLLITRAEMLICLLLELRPSGCSMILLEFHGKRFRSLRLSLERASLCRCVSDTSSKPQ